MCSSYVTIFINPLKFYYEPSTYTHTHTHTHIVRSGELLPAVREARASGNDSKANKLLSGALRQLKLSRLKPDPILNSALTAIAKESPDLFSSPALIEGLVTVLKRETSVIFKAKSNPSVYVLVAQLILVALKDSHDWPEAIAKVNMLQIVRLRKGIKGLPYYTCNIQYRVIISIIMCMVLCRNFSKGVHKHNMRKFCVGWISRGQHPPPPPHTHTHK